MRAQRDGLQHACRTRADLSASTAAQASYARHTAGVDEQDPRPVDAQGASRPAAANRLLYQGLACFVGVSAVVVLSIYLPAPWPIRVALLILAPILLIRGQVVVGAYRRAVQAPKPLPDK